MAFKLRQNEEFKLTGKFHWSEYLMVGIWAALCTPVVLMSIFSTGERTPSTLFALAFGYGPLLIKILTLGSRKYIITNQRLYIEDGILSKKIVDVPLNKINDISFTQNFIERIFDVGSLQVLTGNDKGNTVKGILDPEGFRECLSKYCNFKAQA